MRGSRGWAWLATLACGLWACGEPPAEAEVGEPWSGVSRTARAGLVVGAPVGDYPSYEERVMLYLTNKARTQPELFNPAEPYPPSSPLRYDLDLSVAARFHAEHIIEESCWCADHSSCCQLGGQGEDVSCSGATTGCGAEDASTRVGRFSPDYSGENMAMGQTTPEQAIDGWINSSGHWRNMNSAHGLLGVGRYTRAWVQDFGRATSPAPVAEDGIHLAAPGGSTAFGITYYQPTTGGPQSVLAIVEGECIELELTTGTAELGAFEATRALEPGCHRYYFYVRDGAGGDHVYPAEGSMGVAVGDSGDCPLYLPSRPADTCSPAGQPCETGDTRPCYTGPYGTADVGACVSGVERCIGAQWTGECRLQETPNSEVCGDGVDDDCDGTADEGCPGVDGEGGEPILPGTDFGDGAGEGGDDGGCAVSASGGSGAPGSAGLRGFGRLVLGVVIKRLRRRRE